MQKWSVGDTKYTQTRWIVNDEPLNTFGTLILLFPISEKGIHSCFLPIPNTIVRNFLLCTKMHHLNMTLFRSNMNSSYLLMVLLHCHIWHVTDSLCFVYILPTKSPNGMAIIVIKPYFQIKITNNLQRV